MRCLSCEHENRPNRKFCAQCGAPLSLTCTICGAQNEPGERYCGECGHPFDELSKLAPVPEPHSYTPPHLAAKILRDRATLLGERRTVTVLFADASGFTSLSEHQDEEQVYSLMQGYLGRMMEAVHHYEGTITQFLGDGVMALFGAPIAHEDSARRAVAAALEMQKSLDEFTAEVKQRNPIECRFRVGLNTGPVVVGKINDNLDMDYTALGDTVNLAARMQQVAEPGSVYLSENTYHLVHDYFELKPLGALNIKGKEEPVVAYKVVRERPISTRFEAAVAHGLTPFVGRDQELTVLRGHLEQAKRGQGQVVFISGVAGIGKSRLLHEFQRASLDDGVTLMEGHCISYGRIIPYLPIIDIIKRKFGVEEGDNDERIIKRVDESTANWEKSAQATVPYLKYLLNVDPGDPTVAVMDPVDRRAGIFDSLRALLLQESRHQPLQVIVEDLHWIDKNSADVLTALVDMIGSLPVLMILSYRPSYTHSLGERSYYNRLALGHLAQEDSVVMAEGVLQVTTLPQQVKQIITSKAEGNPLFIEEVTKSLLESGVLRRTNGTYSVERSIGEVQVPDTIQEVILSRIDRLDSNAKEALQLASVIGREFTVRLLERISDIEAQLGETLDELKLLELIYNKAYFPELSYMFKHALTHDVAYRTLLLERRKVLHCIIAASIEEFYADRLSEHYEALAHHYYEGEDWAKALDYLVRAGIKAAAAFANHDALAYFDRALQAHERLENATKEMLIEIYAGRAEITFTMTNFTVAVDNYNLLREVAHAIGNRTLEGQALAGAAMGHVWAHEFSEAESMAQEALAIADEDKDDTIKAGGIFVLCFLDSVRGNLSTGLNRATEAVHLSQKTGQPVYEVNGYIFQNLNHSWRGHYEQAHSIGQEGIKAAEQHRLAWPLVQIRWSDALTLAGHGRYSEAITMMNDTITICERMGEKVHQSRNWNTLGWVYNELCDWGRAIECNQKGLDLALAHGDSEIILNAQINLADSAFGIGERDQAREELEELYASLPKQHEWQKWRYSQHLTHSLGEVLLAEGDMYRAVNLADECLALAEPTESRKNIVKGRRLRGQAFLAQGKLVEAEREISTALEIAKEIGNPPQLWKTHAALGDLRKAQGQIDAGRKAYRAALTVIDGVADDLTDESLRETFLNSDHVQGIRQAAKF